MIDACLWASKHDNREVEAAGLNMCVELVNNVAETDPATSTAFFQQFFIPILQDTFFVLTDTDHKAGGFVIHMPQYRFVNPTYFFRFQTPVFTSLTHVCHR